MIVSKLKDKKCKWCKNTFTPIRPLMTVCSPKCAIEKAKDNIEKKRIKEDKAKDKIIREKLKTLSQYEQEARTVFQKWIRHRDKDLPCISCGRTNAISWDGGHYFDAGSYSGLIFHEDNVHKQCSRPCNKDLHGNKANYRIGLVNKIGEGRVRWLEENKDSLRVYKFTKEELINIKKEYSQRLKDLK